MGPTAETQERWKRATSSRSRRSCVTRGRWAVENGSGVAELILENVAEIVAAFKLWAGLLWERRGGKP
jgi:hypothetical protein